MNKNSKYRNHTKRFTKPKIFKIPINKALRMHLTCKYLKTRTFIIRHLHPGMYIIQDSKFLYRFVTPSYPPCIFFAYLRGQTILHFTRQASRKKITYTSLKLYHRYLYIFMHRYVTRF